MNIPNLTQHLLELEAAARHDLAPAAYEQTLCDILRAAAAPPYSEERGQALLALAGAALRYSPHHLVALRGCCAQQLLLARSQAAVPALRGHFELLFLLAWLQLGAVVELGPNSIATAPPLPPGAALPNGADPALLTDPTLRAQAEQLAGQWAEDVERWRAKQAALDEQTLLANLVRSAAATERHSPDTLKAMAAAMALAPELPPNLRQLLEEVSR